VPSRGGDAQEETLFQMVLKGYQENNAVRGSQFDGGKQKFETIMT
jgi:hypothetical protein